MEAASQTQRDISMEVGQTKRKSRRLLKVSLLVVGILLVMMTVSILYIVNEVTPKAAAVFSARTPDKEGKIIPVNGFNLWYKETGNPNGEPIIVIHGGPGLSSYYFHDYLDFLKQKNKVIFYDQPGTGNSESKSDLQNYSFQHLTDDLDVIVNDYAKKKPVTLLGHSFGAIVALQYALDHPGNVDQLILVSTPFIQSTMQPEMLLKLYRTLPPINDPEATNQWYHQRLTEYYNTTFYHPGGGEKLDLGPASYAPMMSIFKTMQNFSLKDRLPGFDKKTLIIYGEADKDVISIKDQLILHQDLPNSTLIKFENSGHWSFIEEPEKFRKTIMDFLNNGHSSTNLKNSGKRLWDL
ncbi:alpha/beta hydrolase [Paenibacillus sp. chi10]|uniref:Alpha/beta hydrolase n=1 Tax=Paenibacillus suaedae TaxID=3077233 RepID=A0AAJ2N2C7_9BACL|nr:MULTISPECIES: alpha/beta hydrolase [unclassified Paenibacillus]MDT8977368.1 alpha/beta hydrolase [Paenibacillus sp. chi10]